MSEQYNFEVHARKRGQKIVFRIWDLLDHVYATSVLTSVKATRERLVQLEVAAFKQRLAAFEQAIKSEAPRRVANAKEDGFESPFATTGELNDPWKEEGRPVTRSLR